MRTRIELPSLILIVFAPLASACAAGDGDLSSSTFSTFGNNTDPTTFGDPDEEDDEPETGEASGEDPTGDGDPSGDGDGDGPGCGDGQVTGAEVCDGANLAGETCESLGFDGGTLYCLATCSDFDTSGCTSSSCGNGIVDGSDVCDGADLDGQTCQSLGYDGGTLACNPNCSALDTSGCASGGSCGNGILEGTEACDGLALNGATCASLGYSGGTLSCNADCTLNVGGCTNQACGNGVLENGETCDGAALNGQSCLSQGFARGSLTCNATCNGYNTAGCNDGNCCYANGFIGCEVPFVETCVCNLDPYCCLFGWDATCASEALSCGAQC